MTTQDVVIITQKSFKLGEKAQRILWAYAKKYNVNQTAALEFILRRIEELENLTPLE